MWTFEFGILHHEEMRLASVWTFEFGILHCEENRLLLCGLSSLVFFIMRKRGCSLVDFLVWYSSI